MTNDIADFCTRTLNFIVRHRLPEEGAGVYRYALAVDCPTLYSSCYAAMARDLLGDLDQLADEERREWISYLNAHQDDDGLYRDPVIFDQGWYASDPLWCGRAHLACHVITALTCLGGVADRPFQFLTPWLDMDYLRCWLESRDWGVNVAWTGNEIMNIGILLQYARDFHGDVQAARAVDCLLEWLAGHHLNPDTGVWGTLDVRDPLLRSHAVQAAYHWWPLFFYDAHPISCLERAIDTVLATQNPLGGFGWGVHNPETPFESSACEDIDSIDPLVRMSRLTDYRREEVRAALSRAIPWVLFNQMPDGGFVFMRNRAFEYGHPALRSEAGQGAMFPTWFRLLPLALIGQIMGEKGIQWHFVRCPGMQFWP